MHVIYIRRVVAKLSLKISLSPAAVERLEGRRGAKPAARPDESQKATRARCPFFAPRTIYTCCWRESHPPPPLFMSLSKSNSIIA